MASGGETYCADFFKKDKISPVAKGSIDAVALENALGDSETLIEEDDYDSLLEMNEFNNEDRIIAKLFREVVDGIMAVNKLNEGKVNDAIAEIKEEIYLGHKKGFSRFLGIDFCKPENVCGYLRRYAICHAGLVKRAMWHFFAAKYPSCKKARDFILNSNHQKVVSLGGGPGNDLIGFCSALHETPNAIKELDLTVVDISRGWKSVFPAILRKAYGADFGSVSAFMKKMKINTGFLRRNLNKDGAFDDAALSTVVGEADVVLMVKLVSFISELDVEELIQSVVDNMKEGAYFIFIDHPYDKKFLQRIQGLDFIYEKKRIGYKLSFKPSQYLSPSIEASQGNVCVFCKEPDEFTSEEDEESS